MDALGASHSNLTRLETSEQTLSGEHIASGCRPTFSHKAPHQARRQYPRHQRRGPELSPGHFTLDFVANLVTEAKGQSLTVLKFDTARRPSQSKSLFGA